VIDSRTPGRDEARDQHSWGQGPRGVRPAGAGARAGAGADSGAGAGSLRIAEVARRSGVPAKTIRFYEEAGVVPAPERAPNGYRRYGETDVRRLRLVGRLRRLGLPLSTAGAVAERAFAAECRTYVRDVSDVLGAQCAAIDRQVADLLALRAELAALARTARTAAVEAQDSGRRVVECDSCPVVDGPASRVPPARPEAQARRS
jgi:DNA-binding transcriptional MerR regulator